MTDEELEAVIRRALTETVAHVLAGELDTRRLNAITDRALTAARAYAAATLGEIDGYRRHHEPVVHYRGGLTVPSCKRSGMREAVLTDDPGEVTCARCRRTRYYIEAGAR